MIEYHCAYCGAGIADQWGFCEKCDAAIFEIRRRQGSRADRMIYDGRSVKTVLLPTIAKRAKEQK